MREVVCKIGGRVCAFIHNIMCMVKNLLRRQAAVIQLYSILRPYRDTFRDSTDVPKTFRLRCDLCYKLHFTHFSCDFLTTGLTRWSRVRISQSNDYVSQEFNSTHSSTSITCVQELRTFATLRLFATFACFYDFNQIVHRKLTPNITSIGSIT